MDLTEVILNEGKVIERDVEVTLESFDYPEGDFPIREKSPLHLRIENLGDRKLGLSGQMDCTVVIPCGRCLTDVPTQIHIDFDREVDMKLSEEERVEALDQSDFLHGYNLDVDRLVYGEAFLVWPMKVLCRDDCKGLCSVCGQNLNLKTCSCDRTVLDPRMAKIRDIFSNFKEV